MQVLSELHACAIIPGLSRDHSARLAPPANT